MGFFSNVWESNSSSEDFLKLFSGSSETSSGIRITAGSALRNSVVFACNRVLSESIASLPLVLYKEDENGNRAKAKKHPLYKLLNSNPNKESTTMQWRETMITNINLRGNHFTQIIRNKRGDIVSLWGLDTARMTAKRLEKTGEIIFIYNIGSKEVAFNFGDILNVAGLSLDGITGISPISYNRESIGVSVALDKFAGSFFKNGASPSGIFSIQGELSDEAFKRMKEDFPKSYAGMKNHNKPMILEGGASFSPITMTNVDSQFLEARKFQKQDISAIFRVPLHMINDLEKANYNSIEQLSLGFVIYSLTRTLIRIEQCLQRDLLTEKEREDGYYIKHNLSALLRGDIKSRAELYSKFVSTGIFTINDVLKLEDMNEVDNGGNRYMQMAMTTIDNNNDGKNLKQDTQTKEVKNA